MTESSLTNVVNHADGGSPSYGVCQVKLNTAKMFDKDATVDSLLIPDYNIQIASKYLAWQKRRYKTSDCVIAAYNAGKCKKDEKGIVNRGYVKKVRAAMQDYPKRSKRVKRHRYKHIQRITLVETQWRTALNASSPIDFREFLDQKRNNYELYSGDNQ